MKVIEIDRRSEEMNEGRKEGRKSRRSRGLVFFCFRTIFSSLLRERKIKVGERVHYRQSERG